MDTIIKKPIEVTVVRNDILQSKDEQVNGLFVPKLLPSYDVKKIVGAADVRIEEADGIKAFLVGSQMNHERLSALVKDSAYIVTVLDGSTQRQ
jgi:hypothetical protein